jgi:hypothetical protein
MGRQLLQSGVPPEDLYVMRHFYDFDSNGKDVEWTEDLETGADATISAGGGTGFLRLTTGGTANQSLGIKSVIGASVIDDYEQRVMEAAFRFSDHIQASDTDNLAWAFGLGFVSDISDLFADGGASITWTSKEWAGFVKYAGTSYITCAMSSNAGAESKETTSIFQGPKNENQTKTGCQTLRVVVEDTPGDQSIIKYFIDLQGYGDFAPMLDAFNNPIVHRRDESSPTSSFLYVSMKNAANAKERIWLDWWSLNIPRDVIISTGAIA